MKVEFKVAMDKEQASLKNHTTVTLEVGKCDDELMLKYALKAYVVELQSQCRSNWDKFILGDYPKEVKIGDALFASTRGVVTTAKAMDVVKAKAATMTSNQKLKMLLDAGMLTEEQFEGLVELDNDGNILD